MSSLITLDALKVLDAIETKGSFSSAAESLYKVPSALTYTMKRLESDLKVKLFDRSGQRAVLTPAGRLVLSQGREILAAAIQLEEAVHQLSTGWEPKLVIAKDTVLSELPLLKEVGVFTRLGKQVAVSILDESLGGGWDALHSGRADIAVGVVEDRPKGEYQLQSIGIMEFVFAIAPDHPLAANRLITNEDLLRYPSVVVADTSVTLAERSSGIFESRQVIRVQSMASKIKAQELGVGVGFLPKHMIAAELESESLVVRQTERERHPQPLCIAWRRNEEGKALRWFVERLAQRDWGLTPH
ncbi:LysR family transcriptional regulator [Shewanella sp. UCD-KL12]|uniref:LysR family transcriptional regulator n=1 Tax=Shewanella sp. UCD-KL12 TaxID=1917163 RepID=UPI000970B531|nr:LysR family transcriptional regulator [Shewanella sp. UCD-KL12]